ncbi:hypothetical protein, partial [Klebsiella aerogenes]|uniref:hypothetical protein n=1 Tax=Klebsiella aerogenes TaxID=548 RepID=UPI001954CE2C
AGFANGDAQKAGNRVGVLSVARLFLFQSTNIQTGAAWTATARRWTFWPSAAQAHANDSEQYA